MTDVEPALLRVARNNAGYASPRKLKLLVDGEPVARLYRNDVEEIEIEPGEHTIAVSMDWCRSDPVTIRCEPGEEVGVLCGSDGLWRSLTASFLRPSRTFFVRPVPAESI